VLPPPLGSVSSRRLISLLDPEVRSIIFTRNIGNNLPVDNSQISKNAKIRIFSVYSVDQSVDVLVNTCSLFENSFVPQN
jgi:hypothetical protein